MSYTYKHFNLRVQRKQIKPSISSENEIGSDICQTAKSEMFDKFVLLLFLDIRPSQIKKSDI